MFAGLFTYKDAPPPDSWVDVDAWKQALSPFLAPDLSGHACQDNVLLVETQRFNTPWSHQARNAPYREGQLTIAFWGRLDNRKELARQLAIPEDRLDTMTDAELACAAWQRWGEAMPERLLGDFAFAVIDHKNKKLFLGRDPLGVKPLYYWAHPKSLIFATTVSALRRMKTVEPTPDSAWMARYLLHISASQDRTAYREILKLPPGHSLTVDHEGRSQVHRWHAWRDEAPQASRRDPRWLEAYREVLEDAVRCRMPSAYPLGTENSGGLDSSAVTAFLAHFLGEPGDQLHSFGFALCEQEPEFILDTSRACRISNNHLVTTRIGFKDDEALIARNLQVLGYPQEHANGTGHTPFYQECTRQGIRSLFSGYGGDEVVTNPAGHIRYELIDQKRYGALWDILPGNPVTRLLRFGKTVATGYPNPDFNSDFLRAFQARWRNQPLLPEVVTRLGLREDFLERARHGAPYRSINDWIVKGLLRMGYVPTRLENCTLVAAAYGIDYRWPLWDARLVQQYLSTPAIEKVGPKGIGRYLHRRAITGVVPDKVAWKPTKDMGYAALHQEMNESGIVPIAERARLQLEKLHPAVEDLLNKTTWSQQIDRAAQGHAAPEFAFMFRKTSEAITWLNHWLAQA